MSTPALGSGRRLCEVAHATAVAVWFAAVTGAALNAAVIFPKMKQLEPTLAGYPNYTGEHWRLAAGQVAAQGFLVADAVQLVAAVAAVASLLGLFMLGLPLRRLSTGVRAAGVGGAALLLGYHFFVFAPSMNRPLRGYWEAAALGENERAATLAAQFAAMHPTASLLLSLIALCTLLGLVGAVWSISGPRDARPPTLEEPALARPGAVR